MIGPVAPVVLAGAPFVVLALAFLRRGSTPPGIGVAGPTLAYWLRRHGHEPVLFEQAPALRRGGYVIDFWGVGYEIACRMGILPALEQQSYRMETLRLVAADGHRVAGLVAAEPDGQFGLRVGGRHAASGVRVGDTGVYRGTAAATRKRHGGVVS